ncbi:Hypp3642 [Branchiostoma lanceolatum]|uniref:Hypp3642 protein n=1 Tax=Branchiostoma lanceolatum TaxID=7740 RepID=A0A8K0A1Q2_BRALA|nr:Hypp3642 [Branchiostoma lanceolatum]
MSGNVHPMATSLAEFEKAANEKLPEFVRAYYNRPGEGGQTYWDNCQAFKRYRLIPRNLRDVYIRDTSGAEGVQQVLQILKDELSLAMARAGCAKISDIQPSLVVHESYYLNRHLFNLPATAKILKSKY